LAILLLALLPSLSPAMAQAASYPLPEQKSMLMVRLYFGLKDAEGKSVGDEAWRDFLARIVSPRFSAGFTVYDASGQWRDASALLRENTRVLEILGPETKDFRRNIAEITRDYRARFHQKSVGIVTIPACGTF
jgi:hypothetical protein